jgi:signal transduction histidine kinase
VGQPPQMERPRPDAPAPHWTHAHWTHEGLWTWVQGLPGVRSWRFLSDAVFLTLTFPIGLFWFILLIVLGALGVALTIVLVGLLILTAMVPLVRRGAQFERRRVRTFLGEAIPAPYRPRVREGGWWRRRTARFRERTFRRDLAYLALLLPVGIAELTVVFFALGSVVAMIVSPVTFWIGQGPEAFFFWNIDSPGEAVFALLLAFIFFPFAAMLINVTARGHLLFAWRLLGPPSDEALAERVEELTESRSAVMRAAHLERRRIERDLHDGAQQRLVALAMDLGLARERLERDPDGAKELVERSHEESKRVLAELRELVRGIHPAVLSDRGLDAAISAVAGRSPVPVTVDVDLPGRLPEEVEGTAYFLVVEALANISKHSEATEALVSILRDGPWLAIDITDNGRGGANPLAGTGLRGLQDRVAALDGRFELLSPPGGGTTLSVEIPCG